MQLFLGLATVGVWDLYNSLLLLTGPPNCCLPTTVSLPQLQRSLVRWLCQLYVLLSIIWEHSQKGGLPLYLGNRLWDNDRHLVSTEKPATSHLLPHFHLQIETGNCSEFLRALHYIRRSLWLPPLTELSDNCSRPEHATWVWLILLLTSIKPLAIQSLLFESCDLNLALLNIYWSTITY